MALTLTAALGVPTQLDPAIRLTVTGTVPDSIVAGYQFRLGDEILELRYFGDTTEAIPGGTQIVDDRNVWYAQRGVAGTTIATHALGTAVEGIADALVAGTTEVLPDPVVAGATGVDIEEFFAVATAVTFRDGSFEFRGGTTPLSNVAFGADGSLTFFSGQNAILIAADGTITLAPSGTTGITIQPDGTVKIGEGDILVLNPDFSVAINAGGTLAISAGGVLTFDGSPVDTEASHGSLTTAVHGIADTGALLTESSGVLRLRKIVVNFDDFIFDEGMEIFVTPTLYTLQPGDWVYLAQLIVTEAFDDTLGNGANCGLYANLPGWGAVMNHNSNLSLPQGAPIALAHADQGVIPETYLADGNFVWPFTPYPGEAAVPLHLRVDTWTGDGTTGTVEVLLWVAEF